MIWCNLKSGIGHTPSLFFLVRLSFSKRLEILFQGENSHFILSFTTQSNFVQGIALLDQIVQYLTHMVLYDNCSNLYYSIQTNYFIFRHILNVLSTYYYTRYTTWNCNLRWYVCIQTYTNPCPVLPMYVFTINEDKSSDSHHPSKVKNLHLRSDNELKPPTLTYIM